MEHQERDAINKTLRSLLLYHYSVVTSDAELDRLVDQKNIKEDRLYGASRYVAHNACVISKLPHV